MESFVNKYPKNIFTKKRLRRYRSHQWMRNLISETNILPNKIIWAAIILQDNNIKDHVENLPFMRRYGLNYICDFAKMAYDNGACSIALFPEIDLNKRDTKASFAFHKDNPIYGAIKKIKQEVPNIAIICDVAFDAFTEDGHDGIVKDGIIDNDITVDLLAKYALKLAEAGCDILAPSDMMDGRIKTIRAELEKNNFINQAILSYCNKYASSLYGPYRDAIGSMSILNGDKKTYQMDFRNNFDGNIAAQQDIDDGADFLLVKPGLHYLDRIRQLKELSHIPVFAYHVSGEAAMLYFAAKEKLFDFDAMLLETMHAFNRAGCDAVISYFGPELSKINNIFD